MVAVAWWLKEKLLVYIEGKKKKSQAWCTVLIVNCSTKWFCWYSFQDEGYVLVDIMVSQRLFVWDLVQCGKRNFRVHMRQEKGKQLWILLLRWLVHSSFIVLIILTRIWLVWHLWKNYPRNSTLRSCWVNSCTNILGRPITTDSLKPTKYSIS